MKNTPYRLLLLIPLLLVLVGGVKKTDFNPKFHSVTVDSTGSNVWIKMGTFGVYIISADSTDTLFIDVEEVSSATHIRSDSLEIGHRLRSAESGAEPRSIIFISDSINDPDTLIAGMFMPIKFVGHSSDGAGNIITQRGAYVNIGCEPATNDSSRVYAVDGAAVKRGRGHATYLIGGAFQARTESDTTFATDGSTADNFYGVYGSAYVSDSTDVSWAASIVGSAPFVNHVGSIDHGMSILGFQPDDDSITNEAALGLRQYSGSGVPIVIAFYDSTGARKTFAWQARQQYFSMSGSLYLTGGGKLIADSIQSSGISGTPLVVYADSVKMTGDLFLGALTEESTAVTRQFVRDSAGGASGDSAYRAAVWSNSNRSDSMYWSGELSIILPSDSSTIQIGNDALPLYWLQTNTLALGIDSSGADYYLRLPRTPGDSGDVMKINADSMYWAEDDTASAASGNTYKVGVVGNMSAQDSLGFGDNADITFTLDETADPDSIYANFATNAIVDSAANARSSDTTLAIEDDPTFGNVTADTVITDVLEGSGTDSLEIYFEGGNDSANFLFVDPDTDSLQYRMDTTGGYQDFNVLAGVGGGETDTLDGGRAFNGTSAFDLVSDSLGTRKAVRGLEEGSNITITSNDSTLVIASSAGGGTMLGVSVDTTGSTQDVKMTDSIGLVEGDAIHLNWNGTTQLVTVGVNKQEIDTVGDPTALGTVDIQAQLRLFTDTGTAVADLALPFDTTGTELGGTEPADGDVWAWDAAADRFEIKGQTGGAGTADSTAVDTSGGGVYAYVYSTAGAALTIREGANIDLTVNTDTLYIAGPAASGTADSVAIDTSGAGVYAYLYSTTAAAATFREGTGIDFTANTDTGYIAIDGTVVDTVELNDSLARYLAREHFDDSVTATTAKIPTAAVADSALKVDTTGVTWNNAAHANVADSATKVDTTGVVWNEASHASVADSATKVDTSGVVWNEATHAVTADSANAVGDHVIDTADLDVTAVGEDGKVLTTSGGQFAWADDANTQNPVTVYKDSFYVLYEPDVASETSEWHFKGDTIHIDTGDGGSGFTSLSADTTDNGTPDLISTDSLALRAGTNIDFSWTNGSDERMLTISGSGGSGDDFGLNFNGTAFADSIWLKDSGGITFVVNNDTGYIIIADGALDSTKIAAGGIWTSDFASNAIIDSAINARDATGADSASLADSAKTISDGAVDGDDKIAAAINITALGTIDGDSVDAGVAAYIHELHLPVDLDGTGDTIYYDVNDDYSDGDVLTQDGGVMKWETPSGGTSDSIGYDTGAGTFTRFLYPAYLREGSNITFSGTDDTLTISGGAGSGTADSIGVDTGAGTFTRFLYPAYLREGTNASFSVTEDTLTLDYMTDTTVDGDFRVVLNSKEAFKVGDSVMTDSAFTAGRVSTDSLNLGEGWVNSLADGAATSGLEVSGGQLRIDADAAGSGLGGGGGNALALGTMTGTWTAATFGSGFDALGFNLITSETLSVSAANTHYIAANGNDMTFKDVTGGAYTLAQLRDTATNPNNAVDAQHSDDADTLGTAAAEYIFINGSSQIQPYLNNAMDIGVSGTAFKDAFFAGTITAGGGTWTGAHDFGGATSLEIPEGTNPTTDALGEIAWDSDDGGIEVFDTVVDVSVLMPMRMDKQAELIQPDSIQALHDAITLLHVNPHMYPHGITIVAAWLSLETSGSYDLNLEEWSGPSTMAVQNTIVALSIAGATYDEETTFTDASIDADDYVRMDLEPTSGETQVTCGIVFYANSGD